MGVTRLCAYLTGEKYLLRVGAHRTAYELSRYYGLDSEIVELVTPSEAELKELESSQKSSWQYTIATRNRKARWHEDAYCDICLMVCILYQVVGFVYIFLPIL